MGVGRDTRVDAPKKTGNVIARTYLAHGWRYKIRMISNAVGDDFKSVPCCHDLRRHVWVTEFGTLASLKVRLTRIFAQSVVDATASAAFRVQCTASSVFTTPRRRARTSKMQRSTARGERAGDIAHGVRPQIRDHLGPCRALLADMVALYRRYCCSTLPAGRARRPVWPEAAASFNSTSRGIGSDTNVQDACGAKKCIVGPE